MSDFCEASHKNTRDGCYGEPFHPGKHWAFVSTVHDPTGQRDNEHGNMIWEWGNDEPTYPPGVPAGSATLVLSDAELGILIVALQPGSHFFPDLNAKLIATRESIK